MNGTERVVRDQMGVAVERALGIKTGTLQKYAQKGLVPFEWTPGNTKGGKERRGHRRYNLEEVRRTLPLNTVRKRSEAQMRARARNAQASPPAESETRYETKMVYLVTCKSCDLQVTIASGPAVRRYKQAHERAFHADSNGTLKGEA